MDLTLAQLSLLTVVAFLAGVVDAIAGGGGLLTIPALLAVGMPPHLALGTNKGQAVFGSAAALAGFVRAKLVERRLVPLLAPLGFAGSLLGAALVLLIDPAVLRPVVLVLLVGVAAFLAFRPAVGAGAPPPLGKARALGAAIALVLGIYDGFFGPGVGTFLIVAFVWLLGMPVARASANAKVVNFASNLAALLLFASKGTVLLAAALPMAAAQLVGGFIGAQLVIRGGDRLVRRVVLAVVVAMVTKVGFDLWG